ncbi:AbiTii domain-containing protein, partial [Acetobacter cerevisiae]
MTDQIEAEHILELSKELLGDIELDRLSADKLLLKATRLARLVGSDEIQTWLTFEVHGYSSSNPVSLKYMGLTGRWIDYKEGKGHWGSLGQHAVSIETAKARIEATSMAGSVSNAGYLNTLSRNHAALSSTIRSLRGGPHF